MVTDRQVRRLMKLIKTEKTLAAAAAKSGMDEKTARKYRRLGKLPSAVKVAHTWRTRSDPFAEVWEEIRTQLALNPGLEAKTLFEDLQRRYPGCYPDGRLRTLQRRIKVWRALEGPPKEVFFPQKHHPGEMCQSDFTNLNDLGITIGRRPFRHMIYHFVLPYSNWEAGTICFSESFESLSEGLQNALWELGGAPKIHRTDRLSTAVNKTTNRQEFTDRYEALLRHYGLTGRKIQASCPHENGDIEQRHHRFKRALEQSLLLRGSRDFADRAEYAAYLRQLFAQLNANRQARLAEELPLLRRLPLCRLEACKRLRVKVGSSSTIRVNHNAYSVNSRLIGEQVEVHLYVEHLEVWYGQRCVEKIARLRGEDGHRINYRHLIDWLIRKPGAFADYRYREDLFPTHRFRMAYDLLQRQHSFGQAAREYLQILHLAARENETAVDQALEYLLDSGQLIRSADVKSLVVSGQKLDSVREVAIADVHLVTYDLLLSETPPFESGVLRTGTELAEGIGQ